MYLTSELIAPRKQKKGGQGQRCTCSFCDSPSHNYVPVVIGGSHKWSGLSAHDWSS
jgi:hypothetical protein